MVAEDDLGRLILHSPPIRAASRPEIGLCRLDRSRRRRLGKPADSARLWNPLNAEMLP